MTFAQYQQRERERERERERKRERERERVSGNEAIQVITEGFVFLIVKSENQYQSQL